MIRHKAIHVRRPSRVIRKLVCLLLLFALCAVGTAVSESTQITAGDWAFTHAPEESVLLLREDGTAVFKGQEYSWTGDGEFIRLASESGEEISLRFSISARRSIPAKACTEHGSGRNMKEAPSSSGKTTGSWRTERLPEPSGLTKRPDHSCWFTSGILMTRSAISTWTGMTP